MSEVAHNYETQSPVEARTSQAQEALLGIDDLSLTNTALDETNLAKKAQEAQEGERNIEKSSTLKDELSSERRSELNRVCKELANNVIVRLENEFHQKNTDPDKAFSVLQQRYNVLEAIANSPQIVSQFPNLAQAIQEVADIKNSPCTPSEQFARITKMQQKLEQAGVYLNIDFLATGGSFCMEIQGTTKPQEAVLGKLYNETHLDDKLQPCTVLGNEPDFNKKGYAFDGKTYLNPGAVDNAINIQVHNGRFTEAERANMNIENINLATINHEESHRLLGEIYNFPKGYKEIPPDETAMWSIEGIDFQPENYTQVDEFIAHSIGQMTDSYETIENIAQGITALNINENGKLEYKQNPNTDESKAYGLLRAFVMEEVATILEEKGVNNFKEHLLHKRETTLVNEYNKEYNRLKSEFEAAKEIPGNSDQVRELANKFIDQDLKWDEIKSQDEVEWNTTTRDIVQLLGEDGLQRINQKCLAQSQKYMAIIEQRFPRVQKS